MLKVRRNNIYMTRGDTVSLKIDLVDYDGEPYYLVDGDEAIFRVKKSACDKELLIEKYLESDDEGQLYLLIEPADTEYLKFGIYVYEVELITANDDHFTVIDNATLELGKELENHERHCGC